MDYTDKTETFMCGLKSFGRASVHGTLKISSYD